MNLMAELPTRKTITRNNGMYQLLLVIGQLFLVFTTEPALLTFALMVWTFILLQMLLQDTARQDGYYEGVSAMLKNLIKGLEADVERPQAETTCPHGQQVPTEDCKKCRSAKSSREYRARQKLKKWTTRIPAWFRPIREDDKVQVGDMVKFKNERWFCWSESMECYKGAIQTIWNVKDKDETFQVLWAPWVFMKEDVELICKRK